MRRSLTLWALFALAAAFFATPMAGASPSAPNAPAQTVTPFAGTGAANLLEVDASLAGTPIVDVDLTPADTATDTGATPRSTGRAANLDATLLGELTLDDILSVAEQSAPPDNENPAEAVLIPVDADPLLALDVSTARAHARWPGDGVCLPAGEPIVSSFTETASASVLTIPELGGSLATVDNDTGGVTGTHSAITTETVPGQSGRALQSESTTQIDAVTLFQGTPLEFTVEVASAPTLTATATGAPGGATVDFTAPVVNITSPEASSIPEVELINLVPLDQLGGLIDQITDGLEEAVQATVGDAGIADVNIILGEETLETTVAADGTGAAGSAAAAVIEVTVLEALGADPLVDTTIAVAPMEVSVAVPAGGIDCGQPDNPLDLHKDVSQADVAPGATFDYTVSVFNRGPCTLTDVVVTDVITGPAGTTVAATPAPASNVDNTLTWNVGEIEPGGTVTFDLTIDVPSDAPVGTTYRDVLSATGSCGDEPVERTVTLDQPTITDEFSGPCDLALSNKSSSHRLVVPGQTFNYLIHVFNSGSEPCSDITVTDVIDDRLEFVACSDSCTNDGQEVTWTGQSVTAGGGQTLVVTVRVREDASGVLANSAIIDSPDDGGDPVTVEHSGPEITDVSELLEPNPPRLASGAGPLPRGPLPRTGSDLPEAVVAALVLTGLLGLAAGRRLRLT